MNEELKRRHIEDAALSIRTALDTLVYGYGLDTALRVMADEQDLLKRRKDEGQPCSDAFEAAVTYGAGLVVLCEHCNRTHFGTWGSGDYLPGALEDLRHRAQLEPDKYIEWGDVDMVPHGRIDGKEIVFGCPCNAGRRYELWIWNHRYVIAEYLKRRATEETLKAARLSKVAADAAEAVDQI